MKSFLRPLNLSQRTIAASLFSALLLVGPLVHAQEADKLSTDAEKKAYWDKLEGMLPPAPAIDAWQKRTGTLPPDFSKLPKINALPDPLTFVDGRKVRTAADWAARRKEIQAISEKWVWGRVPPRPKLTRAEVLDEHHSDGYLVRNVKLIFTVEGKGPENTGSIRARVYIPDGPGPGGGPMPVLINSDLVGWAPQLLRRGYISAGYAGNDAMDDAAALDKLYPDYDFALLPRRGWAAGFVVDYLLTLPQVDKQKIAIFGYSRNGKMVSVAAALDPRITAVIAGSTGVGGVLPWRTSGEVGVGEGTEATTRAFPTWFAPQLRFFTGREDRLPVDGNLVAAMIAPRPLLMEWGATDQVTSTWGSEQSYYSALKVYKLLGVPDRVGTMRVPGFHGANDVEADLDWLDIQWGRSTAKWTNNLIFPWSWDSWKLNTKTSVDLAKYPQHGMANALTQPAPASVDAWQTQAESLRKSVRWVLGEAPLKLSAEDTPPPFRLGRPPAANAPNPAQVVPDLPVWSMTQGASMGWTAPQKDNTSNRRIMLAGGIRGDLYTPSTAAPDVKLPLVIWLHGYSYAEGYMWPYHADLHPILALVQAGYAVLAFDQSGFGSRQEETKNFYDRYPKWSHMGRMVEDVHTAIDATSKDAQVDANRIYLFGYSIGAEAALYSAALDPRVKGVVSVAGFTPMRTDAMSKGTGGIARFAFDRDFTPKLGFFVGHETQLPYDYQDVLALVAPRPVLVVQPLIDREATPADVHAAVDSARAVYTLYHADNKLTLMEPWDINRLTNKTMDEAIQWMKTNLQ